jgi:hypothetical protein
MGKRRLPPFPDQYDDIQYNTTELLVPFNSVPIGTNLSDIANPLNSQEVAILDLVAQSSIMDLICMHTILLAETRHIGQIVSMSQHRQIILGFGGSGGLPRRIGLLMSLLCYNLVSNKLNITIQLIFLCA